MSGLETVDFDIAPFDSVADLCGDPVGAGLVAFMNGNQFMALPSVMESFAALAGDIDIFYESLPPGVLIDQIKAGRLQMGSLTISLRPDVIAAAPDALGRLAEEGVVGEIVEYASNNLAMLMPVGSAVPVVEVGDLAADGVRIAMPDPKTEGVGRLMVEVLRTAGGDGLVEEVMVEKVGRGETILTQIHHRQSPLWLDLGRVDVAPVWATEARYHLARGAAYKVVPIEDGINRWGRYAIAALNDAPHPDVAKAFVAHMVDPRTARIYESFGFGPPMGAVDGGGDGAY